MASSKCDGCGETVDDIDAGFSPGLQALGHDCGGTWRVVTVPAGTPDDWTDAERSEWEIAQRSARFPDSAERPPEDE